MRLRTYPTLELNGKQVGDYETDCFMMTEEGLDTAPLLFTYACFEDERPLTDNQLYKLSKQYPSVVYILTYDMLSETSPLHTRFANDPIVVEYLRDDNLLTDEEFYKNLRAQYQETKIDISMPISEFLDQYAWGYTNPTYRYDAMYPRSSACRDHKTAAGPARSTTIS